MMLLLNDDYLLFERIVVSILLGGITHHGYAATRCRTMKYVYPSTAPLARD